MPGQSLGMYYNSRTFASEKEDEGMDQLVCLRIL
jgi:hypothetical protein